MMRWVELLLQGPPTTTSAAALKNDQAVPADFRETYQREIVPQLLDFEDHRIVALESIRWRMMVAIPVSLLVIAAGVFLMATAKKIDGDDIEGILKIGLLILGVLWGWVFFARKTYHDSIKQEIFPIIFGHFGPHFHYDPNGRIAMNLLEHYRILPSFSGETISDYVSGLHKDVGIEIQQASLTSGSGKHKCTVFKGLVVRLGVYKKFKGMTVIRRDRGSVGNWMGKKSDLETVRLEDPEFEDRYEVFSTDQVEARYLLTTSFMERLMALENLLDSKLQASFYDKQLLILLPSDKDWFEPASITQAATFVEDIGTIMEQMRILFQIIEVLKLDDRTRL